MVTNLCISELKPNVNISKLHLSYLIREGKNGNILTEAEGLTLTPLLLAHKVEDAS